MLNKILGTLDASRLLEARLTNTRSHLPGNVDRFPNLLPSMLLPYLISVERLIRGTTKACQKGRDVPLDMLLARNADTWRMRSDVLPAMCERGLSFVINGIDEDVSAIGALNATIERDWRVKCWTNAYWSHGSASAFNPHADDHDVLVLQLSGTKFWQCWGALEPLPIKARTYSVDQLPQPEWHCIMHPGDILFLPRGDVHVAEVQSSPSLHITLGIRPPQIRELPTIMYTARSPNEFSRRDMPVDSNADFTAELAWLRGFVDSLDPAELLDQLDYARPPYQPNNLGINICENTLFASTLRRHLPVERLKDGGCQIKPAGWPLVLAENEWVVLSHLHTSGPMTLQQLTTTLSHIDLKQAINSLVYRSLLFAWH